MYRKWKADFARCCSATPSMDRKFAVEVMRLLARCPMGIQQIRSSKIVEKKRSNVCYDCARCSVNIPALRKKMEKCNKVESLYRFTLVICPSVSRSWHWMMFMFTFYTSVLVCFLTAELLPAKVESWICDFLVYCFLL